MLIATGEPGTLGVEDNPRLRFGEVEPGDHRPPTGSRYLVLDSNPAFELSFWCGTCPFLFQRLEGANEKLSIEELSDRLAEGLDSIDPETVDRFADLLPRDRYLPMLLRVEPELAIPGRPGDYFAEEGVATFDIDPFWGLPQYPATPYYRTFQTNVPDGTQGGWGDGHLYEFIVPMVAPRYNARDRVEHFAEVLAGTDAPTAVAVSILDVCQPAVTMGEDYTAHWGLTHFLLDGHHKLEAAATTGRPLRLLSLLAVNAGLAGSHQVERVPALRSQQPRRRTHPADA